MRHPTLLFMSRAYELRANVTPYDAAYIGLAEALNCELVTADARLAHSADPRCQIRIVRSWSGVADDQPASRANTSSTRCERLSSSSITPAYGSGSGRWVTNSVIKEENDVLRRSASRSRRAATAGGGEMMRRTVVTAAV
jgi:hypothetical protein